MQNKLFNSTFELSLRALLLLSIAGDSTVDRLSIYDFITIYGKNFEVSDYNLHGDNDFSFGEFTSRRKRMPEALKALAFDNLVDVRNSNTGFLYSINPNGRETCDRLKTAYSKEYVTIAKKTIKMYGDQSEVKLLQKVSKKSAEALEWR